MIKVCPTCQQKYPEDTEFCAQDGTRLQEMQDKGGDALLGRVLDGRWVVEERIGEGGMGAVYLASQRSVDRRVAIKTLRPELCNSREFVDRFFREARVASTIAHPHCVTILDFGQTDDGTLYLAMEYLEGMPLTHRLRHPDLTVREIIHICIQISSALAAAHDNNVIHRDLKPDNVFLLSISDGSTFTKVLDFGIAKVTDSEEKMTQTGQVFGTPEYMSPEQCRGDKLDGRSDLYSLGCILYRMLGGRPPFESDTPMAVLVSHVSETPRHVREYIERGDVPQELTDLCMQLLAKDANKRPSNAQAVRAKLEEMLGHTASGAVSVVTAPATSDEHLSGQTLATDEAAVVNDGGSPPGQPNPDEQSQPFGPPEAANTPSSSQSLRTEAPQGNTTSPAAVNGEEKKSLVPLILGVGVAVVLGAGCAVTTLYFGYNYFFAEEGEAVGIATLFGGDEGSGDEGGGELSADNADEAAAEAPDDELVVGEKVDVQGDDGANREDPVVVNDKPESGDSQVDDDDNGSKAAETDEDQPKGGAKAAASSGGSKKSEQTAANDSKDNGQDDGDEHREVSNVTINAENANVKINNTDADDQADGNGKAEKNSGVASTGSVKEKAELTKKKDAAAQKEEQPPKPAGSIRQSRLSASGSACNEPDVRSVLQRAHGGLSSCYSSHLSSNPDASGEVILAWNIGTDGNILTSEVLVSEVEDINSCVLGKLDRLRFAPPAGGRCYVRATYQFSP